MAKKYAIVPTRSELENFVFTIFARAKKDRNHSTVLNLKKFNKLLKFKHCKLQSINDVFNLGMKHFYFYFFDQFIDGHLLHYSYFIDPSHQIYLKLVSAIFIKFLFIHQMIALPKL